MPNVVWVRSLVPNEKNSASSAISPAAARRAAIRSWCRPEYSTLTPAVRPHTRLAGGVGRSLTRPPRSLGRDKGPSLRARPRLPVRLTAFAASMIARTCMSAISGYVIASRGNHGGPAWDWPRQALDPQTADRGNRHIELRATSSMACVGMGQELVQRWIEQADRHRQPLHRFKDADEIVALVGRATATAACDRLILGEDHLAHATIRWPRRTCAPSGTVQCPRHRTRWPWRASWACRRWCVP